ncbi:MAG: CmcJ/NvfI family oxidoreductase [Pseudomonadota bacterium]
MKTTSTASLQYLAPGQARPVYVASTGGADAALNISAEFEQRTMPVEDARQLVPAASLEREGFALVHAPLKGRDFYALDSFKAAYEAEISDIVLAASGAREALVFDHTLRSDSPALRAAHEIRETASVIHNDYTDASAEKRLRDLVGDEAAEAKLARRFAIINLWRSIGPLVEGSPLACCDAATIDSADLVASERRAEERVGELELVTWNPAHRWYYFPAMTAEEGLLIKTFDSAQDGRARRSIHTAFDNPLAPQDAAPRESMESRLLVFY